MYLQKRIFQVQSEIYVNSVIQEIFKKKTKSFGRVEFVQICTEKNRIELEFLFYNSEVP